MEVRVDCPPQHVSCGHRGRQGEATVRTAVQERSGIGPVRAPHYPAAISSPGTGCPKRCFSGATCITSGFSACGLPDEERSSKSAPGNTRPRSFSAATLGTRLCANPSGRPAAGSSREWRSPGSSTPSSGSVCHAISVLRNAGLFQ